MPPALRSADAGRQSLLEQYARVFNAVEINSSFYRPHRLATYARWGLSVPEEFRFAVKIPKSITHECRLRGCAEQIVAFMGGVSGLGAKLGALLVQLPPSLVFDETVAQDFFRSMRGQTAVPIACEARNASWAGSALAAVFDAYQVTPVCADPAPTGWGFHGREADRFFYERLHGSPRRYYSSYGEQYLQKLAHSLLGRASGQAGAEHWVIFDNTASGAAWPDAQMLQRLVALS